MCNCELCQVGKKSILEQYAYHYALYRSAKYVLDMLELAGVNIRFSELQNKENYLNTLGCVMEDQKNSGAYLDEIEKKHPYLKNWIVKE
jgi:hypothetical protein